MAFWTSKIPVLEFQNMMPIDLIALIVHKWFWGPKWTFWPWAWGLFLGSIGSGRPVFYDYYPGPVIEDIADPKSSGPRKWPQNTSFLDQNNGCFEITSLLIYSYNSHLVKMTVFGPKTVFLAVWDPQIGSKIGLKRTIQAILGSKIPVLGRKNTDFRSQNDLFLVKYLP